MLGGRIPPLMPPICGGGRTRLTGHCWVPESNAPTRTPSLPPLGHNLGIALFPVNIPPPPPRIWAWGIPLYSLFTKDVHLAYASLPSSCKNRSDVRFYMSRARTHAGGGGVFPATRYPLPHVTPENRMKFYHLGFFCFLSWLFFFLFWTEFDSFSFFFLSFLLYLLFFREFGFKFFSLSPLTRKIRLGWIGLG